MSRIGLRSPLCAIAVIATALGLALVAAAELPAHAQDAAGEVRIGRGEEGRGSEYVLTMAEMPEAPAAGTLRARYVLWARAGEGKATLVGDLAMAAGLLEGEGSVAGGLAEQYDTLLVSVETEAEPKQPGVVVARGEWEEERLVLLRLLLADDGVNGKGALYGAWEQGGVAEQHAGFLVEAAAGGDLAEARNHAEHVVNLLDGRGGVFYGDLNRDGQEQNPGDGVGVREYLEELRGHLLAEVDSAGLEEGERNALLQALALTEDGEALLVEAWEQAMKLFSADTAEEAVTLGADLGEQVSQLMETQNAIYDAALSLATLELFAEPDGLASESLAAENAASLILAGEVRIGRGEEGRGSEYVLTMAEMPEAPAAGALRARYVLWARAGEGEAALVGDLAMAAGLLEGEGSVAGGLAEQYDTLLVSVETEAEPEQPGVVVARGEWEEERLVLLRLLLADDGVNGKGALYGAWEQGGVAEQHAGFLVEAAAGGDLAEARNHAEHVVNLLDGRGGVFYGDLNRDGQEQNPGDGVGVREYLEELRGHLLAEVDSAGLEEGERNALLQALALTEDGEALLVEAREQAMKLFSADTAEEAVTLGADLGEQVSQLMETQNAIYDAVLSLATLELFADIPALEKAGAPIAAEVVGMASTNQAGRVPPPPGAQGGDRWENPLDGIVYVYVSGGEYTVGADAGSSRERPTHAVTVDGFWIQETETTNAQYARCVAAGVCTEPGNERWDEAEYATHPVTDVDWEQARTYAEWVGGRLPTEAEWEAACRGVGGSLYPWGDAPPTAELSNYGEDVGDTMPAGSYPDGVSSFGTLDMAGNVWEWTSTLDMAYPYDATDGREDAEAEGKRIMRGGSFYYAAQLARCTARTGANIDLQIPHLGLRPLLPETGERWENPLDGIVYVYVSGGEYTVGADAGSSRERPAHAVTVDGFWIQETETTNAQYARCVAAGVCTEPGNERWDEAEYATHPVTDVDWEQARTYAEWVGGRLPTEVEWEAACRGVGGSLYPWGDAPPTAELSNYGEDVGDTMPAGSYPDGVSSFGTLDMAGNVWEWTSTLDMAYPYDATDGREDAEAEGKRIMRGGSFYYAAQLARCTARTGANIDLQIPHLGLRPLLPAH